MSLTSQNLRKTKKKEEKKVMRLNNVTEFEILYRYYDKLDINLMETILKNLSEIFEKNLFSRIVENLRFVFPESFHNTIHIFHHSSTRQLTRTGAGHSFVQGGIPIGNEDDI